MGRVTPQWSVMGGYAYTDAEITRTISTARAGAVVAQVPSIPFPCGTATISRRFWDSGLG